MFRCMHDNLRPAVTGEKGTKPRNLTERARAAPSPRPVLSERRSNAAKKIPNSEALVFQGQTVFPAEIAALKQLYSTVSSWSYEEFLQRVRIHPSLQRLAPLLPAALSRKLDFEELLVKMFRDVNRREMEVMMRWAVGEEHVESEVVRRSTEMTPKGKPQALFTSPADVQLLFSLYDTNTDGSLSLSELQSALGHLLSLQDITDLFSRYDVNKDQKISLAEFMSMMGPD